MITIGINTKDERASQFVFTESGDGRLEVSMRQCNGKNENFPPFTAWLDKSEVEEMIFALQSALKVIM